MYATSKAEKDSVTEKCFNKYKNFFFLMEKYPERKKLVCELLNIYIVNNDSFPQMFTLNGKYPENLINLTLYHINRRIKVKWIDSPQPVRPVVYTRVGLMD